MEYKASWIVTILNIHNLDKMKAQNDYIEPTLTTIECCVEEGFIGSSIGDNEGNYIPDFETENNL